MIAQRAATPGPWRAERNTYNTLVTVHGGVVALVYSNGAADVELIAAAPKMLDALESLVAAVALDLHPETVREAIAKAQQAIADARSGE